MRGIRECVGVGLCALAATVPGLGVAAAAPNPTPPPIEVKAPQGITFQLRPMAACWPDRGGMACYHENSSEWVRIRPNGSKPKITYAPTGIRFPKKVLGANQWTYLGSRGGVICIDTRPKAAHVACMANPKRSKWVVLFEKGQFHVVDSDAPIWAFWNYI